MASILEWINVGLYAAICYMVLRYYLYPLFLLANEWIAERL